MSNKISTNNFVSFGLYLLMTVYGLILVINSNFGIIDDHHFLDSLLSGKPMHYFVMPEIGRFFPLAAREYSLISFLSNSVTAFYIYNFLQYVTLIFLMYKIQVSLVSDKYKNLILSSLFLLSLSPGFVTSWFRLFVPERNVLFFSVVFLFSYLRFDKNQQWIYAIIGIFAVNVALYYKEPSFLLFGGFAIFHLYFSSRESNFKKLFFDLAIILSSLVFLIFYYFEVFQYKGNQLYGFTTINPFLVLTKNLFNLCLGDPVVIFLLMPLFFWRTFLICFNKEKPHPLFDSLIFASLLYVFVFFKLNMYAYHYLLPIYAFSITALLHFFLADRRCNNKYFKFLGGLSILFIVLSTVPMSAHLISRYKNDTNNFQKTLYFLNSYIKDKSRNSKRVVLFLDGVNKGSGVEVYNSFIKNLEFMGLTSRQFDFKVLDPDDGIMGAAMINRNSKYTAFNQITESYIQSGDLLLMTPHSQKYFGLEGSEISSKLNEYVLIFHADSFLSIPNYGIKAFLKSTLKNTDFRSSNDKVIISENVYALPLDYYIFRKN
jgi:hypothetical protein